MAQYFQIFQNVLVDVGFASCVYMIAALQIQGGFDRAFFVATLVPVGLVFMASGFLMFLFDSKLPFLGIAAFTIWGGLRIRKEIQDTEGGISLWLVNSFSDRWPMLGFDSWTLGISGLILAGSLARHYF